MGVLTRQGPLYFQPSPTDAYRDGWDRIFGKRIMSNEESTEQNSTEKDGTVKLTVTAPNTESTETKKRGRGRPKGSKNKKSKATTNKLEVTVPPVPKELPSADYRQNVEGAEEKTLDGSNEPY